ncbi:MULTISPECIES: immune inhibitor A domain-containing protein [Bacillus cereus group]|uniref:immune inhibitor A domain-containing protein n=1 Tax=Bacillus cereus group TaxID=86661 RepID=UPI001AEE8DBD|nr:MULTISPECIES: immune inhibitor A domain-containing protein [Bacillus cereus group]QTR72104.1 immune inhibitor A [Bacillus cytotoxicus]QTR77239.1 immune inhibitor A [Bacillus cytotoxicus]HDR4570696.1 immune inhibitor A [Bacillus cytotoxicus]HDR4586508.1 immune inhibitor A [Bacillus cytotoxicus]HDR7313128.1 immune inhibitor A [Bacillus cytotoxicus]
MKKKPFKVLSALAVAAVLGGAFSFGSPAVQAETSAKAIATSPIDDHLIPEERLANALKKRGVINEKASDEETKKAVEKYVEKKKGDKPGKDEMVGDQVTKEASEFLKKVKDAKTDTKEKGKEPASGQTEGTVPAKSALNGKVPTTPAKEKKYNGEVRKDKVLVLLVEYDDFKHNNIEQEPGYMYSDDFNQEHYEKMLFGDEPFTLHDGSKIETFKQYYEEQSGGSYTVDGTVSKWLTVPGKAADYGADAGEGHDNKGPLGPRDLIKDALKAAVESGIDLSEFDQFDQYDIDGDGNKNEPDGLVDHLMVIHAGVGQEAGGGKLGDDAIWSHRWTIGQKPFPIDGTTAKVPYWDGKMAAFDYTIEPEDGAVGVFAHEYGHDLGLPDEYDTKYSGGGEPVQSWSIMSGGSWAGKIAGTTPTSFSPQNKEFFQKTMGGNWANIVEIDYEKLNRGIGYATYLDQSVTKSNRPGLIRVNLPDKDVKGIEPAFGQKYYYSTKGDDLHTTLETPLFDLTSATNATFDFKSLYEIETGYDFLEVHAVTEDGTKTLIDTIGNKDVKDGADTTLGEWVDKSYDLSQFKGKKVKLVFEYVTDGGLALNGFTLDNASLTVDGNVVFSDDAEGETQFKLNGFVVSNGIEKKSHNYYVEWRNYAGADEALKYARGPVYNTGMVVWYADASYTDNWVGVHPGHGFLGVVDSHPEAIAGTLNGKPTFKDSTRYQIADAAFSFDQTPAWKVVSPTRGTFEYNGLPGVAKFDDSKVYINDQIPDAGRILPKLGLKFEVVGQADDKSAGAVRLYR